MTSPTMKPASLKTLAVILAESDPEVGFVNDKNGFVARVERVGSGRRLLTVRAGDGREMWLMRFPPAATMPPDYPVDTPFLRDRIAWAGNNEHGSAAIWLGKGLADAAAEAVTLSVSAGWDLENASKVTIPIVNMTWWNTIFLVRAGMRRNVSVNRARATLIDYERKTPGK